MSTITEPTEPITVATPPEGRGEEAGDESSPIRFPSASIDASPSATETSNDAIAGRAYEFFLERGGEHGHDLDDWLQAERELRGLDQQAMSLTRELNEKPAN